MVDSFCCISLIVSIISSTEGYLILFPLMFGLENKLPDDCKNAQYKSTASSLLVLAIVFHLPSTKFYHMKGRWTRTA